MNTFKIVVITLLVTGGFLWNIALSVDDYISRQQIASLIDITERQSVVQDRQYKAIVHLAKGLDSDGAALNQLYANQKAIAKVLNSLANAAQPDDTRDTASLAKGR